jgi:DNA-binding response OmpR family regulator
VARRYVHGGIYANHALVDDDRNILTSLSIALEAEGFRIMTYTDGFSALDGFESSPPDLAILYIKMPRKDGMETLHRLRQTSDVPVNDDQVYVDDRTIDSHIKRLRKKFRQVEDSFDMIETLYGVGYRFTE